MDNQEKEPLEEQTSSSEEIRESAAQEQSDAREANLTENESKGDEMADANQLQQMSDKYLRLVAEFDNYKKRSARERNELIKNAGEDIIASLLEVLDDTVRAEEQFDKANDVKALKTGLDLIFGKLKTILKNKGLTEMKSIGEDFNPELHEAITEVPVPDEKLKGKVVDEILKGYYLNDKIIRHAKVVVGK